MKKLTLNRDTIRELTPDGAEAEGIIGGGGNSGFNLFNRCLLPGAVVAKGRTMSLGGCTDRVTSPVLRRVQRVFRRRR